MEHDTIKYPFVVTLEADGSFHIVFPDLPGCMSGADSWDEIVPMAREALELWLQGTKEDGRSIPAPTIGDPGDELPWRFPLDRDAPPTYSTREVADKLGVTPNRVHALARARHVGRRIGNSLAFTAADVERMKDRKPGRPRQVVHA